MWERKETKQTENTKKSEEDLINSIRNPFILKREKKEKKEIKDRIIRDIRTLFEEEEDYYKAKRVNNSGIMIILNMKVIVIVIKTYP